MFTVKWVVRHNENEPVETEDSILTRLDEVVASCKERLYGMRLRYATNPPDGFIVYGDDGTDVRRWYGALPLKD